jgi:hypothetical protein
MPLALPTGGKRWATAVSRQPPFVHSKGGDGRPLRLYRRETSDAYRFFAVFLVAFLAAFAVFFAIVILPFKGWW